MGHLPLLSPMFGCSRLQVPKNCFVKFKNAILIEDVICEHCCVESIIYFTLILSLYLPPYVTPSLSLSLSLSFPYPSLSLTPSLSPFSLSSHLPLSLCLSFPPRSPSHHFSPPALPISPLSLALLLPPLSLSLIYSLSFPLPSHCISLPLYISLCNFSLSLSLSLSPFSLSFLSLSLSLSLCHPFYLSFLSLSLSLSLSFFFNVALACLRLGLNKWSSFSVLDCHVWRRRCQKDMGKRVFPFRPEGQTSKRK